MARSRIYYLCPDSDVPSWGNGLLYGHVRLLRELGFEAFALHRRSPFRFGWLEGSVPLEYLDSAGFSPSESDLLVVPEVAVKESLEMDFPGRRGVFVQGSFLILRGFESAIDYRELGFSFCLAVLPHVKEIVDRHYGLEATVIPPFVAPYFFAEDDELVAPREKTILAYANRAYVDAGYPDFPVVEAILRRAVTRELRGWELRTLEGLSHRETAELLKRSAILVNVNVLEAFNTTVPEAMAAGCLAVCYDAFGGRDFLVDGVNCFRFSNNHVYPLVEKVIEIAEQWSDDSEPLRRMRREARATAAGFSPEQTREQLRLCFGALLDGLEAPVVTRTQSSTRPDPICDDREMLPEPVLQPDVKPAELRERYRSAEPFPHIVLDDLFAPTLVRRLLGEFPEPDGAEWRHFENLREQKLGYDFHSPLGETLTRFMVYMSSPPMLDFLEQLTGIDGLIPDPYFGGAGPHQILPGGFLKIHADFNVHPKLKLDRRLNLLLYLNEDWEESYGGHLELWSTDMSRCVERILPVLGRTVVFSTTSDSYHGHPDPLSCPPGRSRRSLSFYYYTNGRPDEERSEAHDTLFKERYEGEWTSKG